MGGDEVSRRVERLEESQMFGERRLDELAEQMAALERAVSVLSRRIEGVHGEVERVGERIARFGPSVADSDGEPDAPSQG